MWEYYTAVLDVAHTCKSSVVSRLVPDGVWMSVDGVDKTAHQIDDGVIILTIWIIVKTTNVRIM